MPFPHVGRLTVVALALLAGGVAHAEQPPAVVAEVRAAIAQKDFDRGDTLVSTYRKANGVTPEMLEALS